MPLSADQVALLRRLQPRAWRAGTALAFTAPSWAMRQKLSLESFLPDLEHPTRGPIAWRDFANIPSNALKPFFQNPEVLDSAAREDILDPTASITWDADEKRFSIHERLRPRPGRAYSIAADLSVSGDATGLAMTHLEPDGSGEIDFSLMIRAKPRVDYRPIENLIVELRDVFGFTILGVSFDQFQSHRTIDELIDKGFDAKVVKYADSFAGCSTVSDMVHSGLLRYHRTRDQDFIGEAKELQSINDKRVDHLQSGGLYNSKDVWDAVVNSVVRALEADRGAGLRLTPEDIHTYDLPELLATLQHLKDAKRPGPHVQVAHVYTRLGENTDTTALAVALVARDPAVPTVYVLNAYRRREPLPAAARFLLELQTQWAARPLLSTLAPFAAEVTTHKSKDADALNDALQAAGSDLTLAPSLHPSGDSAKVETTKELVRQGAVRFPAGWRDDHELARLVRRLLDHPFVPDTYELLALAGAVSTAAELEALPVGPGSKGPRTPKAPSRLKGW